MLMLEVMNLKLHVISESLIAQVAVFVLLSLQLAERPITT